MKPQIGTPLQYVDEAGNTRAARVVDNAGAGDTVDLAIDYPHTTSGVRRLAVPPESATRTRDCFRAIPDAGVSTAAPETNPAPAG